MSGAATFDYCLVHQLSADLTHVADDVRWRLAPVGQWMEVFASAPLVTICGTTLDDPVRVMRDWGTVGRCIPCEIIARYRGYQFLEREHPEVGGRHPYAP